MFSATRRVSRASTRRRQRERACVGRTEERPVVCGGEGGARSGKGRTKGACAMRRLIYRLIDRLHRPVYTRIAEAQYRRDCANYYQMLAERHPDTPIPVEVS